MTWTLPRCDKRNRSHATTNCTVIFILLTFLPARAIPRRSGRQKVRGEVEMTDCEDRVGQDLSEAVFHRGARQGSAQVLEVAAHQGQRSATWASSKSGYVYPHGLEGWRKEGCQVSVARASMTTGTHASPARSQHANRSWSTSRSRAAGAISSRKCRGVWTSRQSPGTSRRCVCVHECVRFCAHVCVCVYVCVSGCSLSLSPLPSLFSRQGAHVAHGAAQHAAGAAGVEGAAAGHQGRSTARFIE
jgi:hypothetical protein